MLHQCAANRRYFFAEQQTVKSNTVNEVTAHCRALIPNADTVQQTAHNLLYVCWLRFL